MLSDQEIKKQFDVFVDENDIIHIVVSSEADRDAAIVDLHVRRTELVIEALLQIFRNNPDKKFGIFLDVSHLTDIRSFPYKTRRLIAAVGSEPQIGKTAVVGHHPLFKWIASAIARLILKQDFRWFDSREKALEWLKE